MTADKYVAGVGENITFTYNATNATGFILGIDKQGVGRISTPDMGNATSYTTSFDTPGKYYIYATYYNSYGGADTKSISFFVYNSAPTNATLITDKDKYDLGEAIKFTYKGDGITGCWIGIDKVEDNNSTRILTKNISNSNDFIYSIDKSGTYTAYVTVSNKYGQIDTERIYFSIGDITQPPYFTIENHDTYIDIINTSDDQQAVALIVAEYNNDNILSNVTITDTIFAALEKRTIILGNGMYKVFVWDSIQNMKPLTQ